MLLPIEVMQTILVPALFGKKRPTSRRLWMLMCVCKQFREVFQPLDHARLSFIRMSKELWTCIQMTPPRRLVTMRMTSIRFAVPFTSQGMLDGAERTMIGFESSDEEEELVEMGKRTVMLEYGRMLTLSIRDECSTGTYITRIWVLDASVKPIRLVSVRVKPDRRMRFKPRTLSYQGVPVESFEDLWGLVRSKRIMRLWFNWDME